MSAALADVMWCHHCETFQLRGDMPVRVPFWDPSGRPVRVCVCCDGDEPEGLGVWHMAEQPDPDPCWREHAVRRDSLYPGDCNCDNLKSEAGNP